MRNDKDVIRNDKGKLVFTRDIKEGESFEMDFAHVREIELGLTEAPQSGGDVATLVEQLNTSLAGMEQDSRNNGKYLDPEIRGQLNGEISAYKYVLGQLGFLEVLPHQPPASTGLEALQNRVMEIGKELLLSGNSAMTFELEQAVIESRQAALNDAPKCASCNESLELASLVCSDCTMNGPPISAATPATESVRGFCVDCVHAGDHHDENGKCGMSRCDCKGYMDANLPIDDCQPSTDNGEGK